MLVHSVVYNVVEQLMLDFLRNDVIGEVLHAHMAKFVDIDEAVGGSRERLLTSNFLMAPIGTFIRCKRDIAMEDRKYSTTVSPKGPVNIIPTFDHSSESPLSRFDYRIE